VRRFRVLSERNGALDAREAMIALRQQQRIRVEQCQPATDLLAAEWVLAAHRALAEQRHAWLALENRLPRARPACALDFREAGVELRDAHDEALLLLFPEVMRSEDAYGIAVDLRDHVGDPEAPGLNFGRVLLIGAHEARRVRAAV